MEVLPIPSGMGFSSLREGMNSALPGETGMAAPEAVAVKTTMIFLRTQPPALFASRPIVDLSQRALKGEIQSVAHEEVSCTPKELPGFSNL